MRSYPSSFQSPAFLLALRERRALALSEGGHNGVGLGEVEGPLFTSPSTSPLLLLLLRIFA